MNDKIKSHLYVSAFTLIELLVVISVIGILVALVTFSLSSAQTQARDAARKSDLKQFQNAIEVFANKSNGFYLKYTGIGGTSWQSFCNAIEVGSNCPNDPIYDAATGLPTYMYRSDLPAGGQGSPVATRYVLYADLENGGFWVVCSEGKAFESNSAPTGVSACD